MLIVTCFQVIFVFFLSLYLHMSFFLSFFSILYLILYHVHCFIGVPLPLHSLISIYLYIYLQIYTRGEARLYARPQYILPVKKRVNALSEVDVRQFHTIKKKEKKSGIS